MKTLLFAVLLLSIPEIALAQSADFSSPCSTHIQSSWPEDLRQAAAADCAFFQESQSSGAEAWAKYADEKASMAGIQGRDEIRARFQSAYSDRNFHLVWHPTNGNVYGAYVITTGPWERHGTDEHGGVAVTHGYYLTVWKKQADGSWRYVWDGGEETK